MTLPKYVAELVDVLEMITAESNAPRQEINV